MFRTPAPQRASSGRVTPFGQLVVLTAPLRSNALIVAEFVAREAVPAPPSLAAAACKRTAAAPETNGVEKLEQQKCGATRSGLARPSLVGPILDCTLVEIMPT